MINNLITKLLSDKYTVAMLAINAVMLISLIMMYRQRKRTDHIYEISARDQRLAELDQRIANPEYLARTDASAAKRYPYETTYRSQASPLRHFDSLYVGLMVETEMMQQRYFTDTREPIEIGSGPECSITVPDDRMAARQLVLFQDDNKLYLKNLSEDHSVILKREDGYFRVDVNPVEVQNNDCLQAGSTYITITTEHGK